MVRDNRHVSAYLFGAICPPPASPASYARWSLKLAPPARAVGAALIMPSATSEAMNKHLVEISATIAPGAHAILVCDGAGWHQTGKRLIVPNNITLLPLPPYTPELNPMENVWAYLRQNKLCALANLPSHP